MSQPADVTTVIPALEDQTWRVLTKSGADFLPFLSPDCILQFPFGMCISTGSEPSIKDVMTSDAFVPWRSYRMSNVVVTPVGTDGAVISYRVKADRPDAEGREDRFRALICSVWRKEPGPEGTWLMCFHQQTPFDHGVEDLVDEGSRGRSEN